MEEVFLSWTMFEVSPGSDVYCHEIIQVDRCAIYESRPPLGWACIALELVLGCCGI